MMNRSGALVICTRPGGVSKRTASVADVFALIDAASNRGICIAAIAARLTMTTAARGMAASLDESGGPLNGVRSRRRDIHSVSYIFLSFASADAELAHRALGALERAGIPCWIADRDIEISTSYPAAISAAIKSSAGVLLLLTETANASPHVLREVELAFNARKPIAPVRLAH